MTTIRPSLVPRRDSTSKTPGPPLYMTPTTLLSSSVSFSGTHPITLCASVIIQLRSRLSSFNGPIHIGEGTIINERVSVGCRTVSESQNQENGAPTAVSGVNIGQGVLIESGAVVEASSVGAYTTIEAGAMVGKGAVVGERCKICAKVEVGEGWVVNDGTIVWGSEWGECRVEKRAGELDGKREGWVKEQGEVMRRVWTGR